MLLDERDAGIVDEHVERLQVAHVLGEHLHHRAAVGDVARQRRRIDAERAHLLRDRLGRFGADVVDADRAALTRERERDLAAEPRPAAGDQRDFAFELHRAPPKRGKLCGSRRRC